MVDLPSAVQAHVVACCLATRAPAWLLVHQDGRFQAGQGALERYGLAGLQSACEIESQVPCLQGLWPFTGTPCYLPALEILTGTFADIHLFAEHTDVWVLFLDATAQVVQQRRLQQKANEMRWLQDHYWVTIGQRLGHADLQSPVHALREALTTLALLTQTLEALDMVVFERMPDGALQLTSTAPAWFINVCPEAATPRDGLQPGSVFPVLGPFLQEAEAFWARQGTGRYTSLPWSLGDAMAQEYSLEASALCCGKHQLLCLVPVPRPRCPGVSAS
ncbi:MAG: hypothetical protein FJZ47_12285 [Candidatus Tectomicrobia bacterium]|uniref:Uncharacterized protein n=1 Tax=Tectimicrobiota bacterium TaxID=2528274 RepID=A0A938B4D4_UNCTE|nr:hypothetical protein [Candidatus Tectomicrobia bacterium]